MFNQPHLNEMMARETIEYRVRDAETLRRGRALASKPRRQPRGRRRATMKIRHAARHTA